MCGCGSEMCEFAHGKGCVSKQAVRSAADLTRRTRDECFALAPNVSIRTEAVTFSSSRANGPRCANPVEVPQFEPCVRDRKQQVSPVGHLLLSADRDR